jgi:hypothetical protein
VGYGPEFNKVVSLFFIKKKSSGSGIVLTGKLFLAL